jgi:hypothetical protein
MQLWKCSNAVLLLRLLPAEDDSSVNMTEEDAADSAIICTPPPLKRACSFASSSSSSSRSTVTQSQMSMYIDAPLDAAHCIMMMLVMNGFPLSAIDDPYVNQAFQRVAKSGYQLSMSRKTMRNMLILKHKAMKEELVRELKAAKSAVSFLLDGWTNVVHAKVTNVLLV